MKIQQKQYRILDNWSVECEIYRKDRQIEREIEIYFRLRVGGGGNGQPRKYNIQINTMEKHQTDKYRLQEKNRWTDTSKTELLSTSKPIKANKRL